MARLVGRPPSETLARPPVQLIVHHRDRPVSTYRTGDRSALGGQRHLPSGDAAEASASSPSPKCCRGRRRAPCRSRRRSSHPHGTAAPPPCLNSAACFGDECPMPAPVPSIMRNGARCVIESEVDSDSPRSSACQRCDAGGSSWTGPLLPQGRQRVACPCAASTRRRARRPQPQPLHDSAGTARQLA